MRKGSIITITKTYQIDEYGSGLVKLTRLDDDGADVYYRPMFNQMVESGRIREINSLDTKGYCSRHTGKHGWMPQCEFDWSISPLGD